MFGRSKTEAPEPTKEIGLLGTDTKFEGSIRFSGTLRIDGTVVGNVSAHPGSGSVLIVNQQASINGDIVSDSVLISGSVQGNVRASERVEIFRSGLLKGDVFTAGIMIEGGAEFQGRCHMTDGGAQAQRAPIAPSAPQPPRAVEEARAAQGAVPEGAPGA